MEEGYVSCFYCNANISQSYINSTKIKFDINITDISKDSLLLKLTCPYCKHLNYYIKDGNKHKSSNVFSWNQ